MSALEDPWHSPGETTLFQVTSSNRATSTGPFMLLGLPFLAVVTVARQVPDPGPPRHPPDPPPPPTSVVATRAAQPPVIDGRDDDVVWREAQPIIGFQEWRPSEGGPPKLPTEAKVAYDAGALYVFVRSFDPHPDSIITVLSRRDYFTPSDMIWLFLDSYHDRRTGYEFGVNPSGVKLDAQIYNDGNEDFAWDAVWDVATRVDSLGWTAEFRIPLSQLRYGRERTHTFGFTVDRDLYRYSQRVSWPLLRQSRAGFVSQLGEISGLDDLVAPRRLEAAPYLVTKNVSQFTATGIGRSQDVTIGGDLKYRVTSNFTLDATLNPDFGQVEADPGVLNLTAFETFFSERRPFFVAGRGLFRFDVNCNDVNCSSEGLVYSRRIGRAPELAGAYSDTTSPAFTTILGAGKLTGRLPGGLTIGALDAVTAHVTGAGGATRSTPSSGRTRGCHSTRRARRSPVMPRSCRSPRWAARTCRARPATSDAPPVLRSTTWATCSARTSSPGARGSDTSTATSAPCTSGFSGIGTGGNTGPARACPKSGRSTPTRTSRSATPGRSMAAARSASWARRTATLAPAAALWSGRIRTSRRGPA